MDTVTLTIDGREITVEKGAGKTETRTFSVGGGYVFDEVLEYRVWFKRWDGQSVYCPFATFEEAQAAGGWTTRSGILQVATGGSGEPPSLPAASEDSLARNRGLHDMVRGLSHLDVGGL